MQNHTTMGLTPKEKLPFWNDVVCRTYVPVECKIDQGRRFNATIDIKKIGRLGMTRVRSEPARYRRTAANIRTSRDDDYLLSLLVSGKQHFEQAGRSTEIGPGDLCLFDTSRKYELNCDGYEAIHLKIPRVDFDMRLPAAETVSAMRVASSGRYAQLAATMIRSTFDTVSSEKIPPIPLGSSLLDLIALAFDECFNDLSKGDSRYSRIVDCAKEIIMDNLFDPEFDISTVPVEIGVSPRTLSRAFAQHGITSSKWMWSKRLETAKTLLESTTGQSVSEVALKCGFNDFSHFSRAFKLRYQITPSAAMGRRH